VLHRFPQSAIIGRVRVAAHECILDEFIASIDLLVGVTLIVMPDPTAAPRHHGSDAEQPGHLTWLKYASLRVHERDAVALEFETGGKIVGIEHATVHGSEPLNVIERSLTDLGIYV
jgi:hypothetical protein